jgi:hypothetical protein
MVGGINPLGILIPLAFAVMGAMLLPALLLPWKAFCAYAALGISTPLILWYSSGVDGITIVLCAALGMLAIAIALPVHSFWGRKTGPLKPKPSVVAMLLLAVPIFVLGGIEFGKLSWRRHMLPTQFSKAKAIYLPRVLVSHCEMDVWQLPGEVVPSSLAAHHGWLSTPYSAEPLQSPLEDRWLNGIGCSKADLHLREQIIDAMGDPGAMYLRGSPSGFILVPSRRVLVRSYAY